MDEKDYQFDELYFLQFNEANINICQVDDIPLISRMKQNVINWMKKVNELDKAL